MSLEEWTGCKQISEENSNFIQGGLIFTSIKTIPTQHQDRKHTHADPQDAGGAAEWGGGPEMPSTLEIVFSSVS